MNHHILSFHETQQLLSTSRNGLFQSDAEERLLEKGRNEFVEKRKTPFWILLFAAAILIAIGDVKDAALILSIILMNALIGFIQEYKAENEMAALNLNSLVLRGGKLKKPTNSKI